MHTNRSGWDKRQATLILYIFADGVPRIKPKLIFKGKPTEEGGHIESQEAYLYSQDVTIHFNNTAYNNKKLTLQFIDKELLLICQPAEDRELLLALDAARFHKTPAVLQKLKENHIIPPFVPPGCTGILQPLDTAVNKPFKEMLREETELYTDAREDAGENVEGWSVSQKRIMVTHVVAAAWRRFCSTKQELIQKAFKDVGLSIAWDGSEDHLLSIKGYEHGKPEIKDWRYVEEDKDMQEFQEIPFVGEEIDEYIEDSEVCISLDYRGLLKSRLQALIIERGLPGRSKNRPEMVAILQRDDLEKRPIYKIDK
jgi:hypothetical protein